MGILLDSQHVRAPLHLLTVAALMAAFCQSPFAHFHEGESLHSREHAQTHSHLDLHEDPDYPVWEAEEHEDDTRWVEWLAGDGSIDHKFWVTLPSVPHVISLAAQTCEASAPTPCNHDPPWRAGLPARSPPQ
jgi:hypothetical protein